MLKLEFGISYLNILMAVHNKPDIKQGILRTCIKLITRAKLSKGNAFMSPSEIIFRIANARMENCFSEQILLKFRIITITLK